jgi:hypothetical protein
VFSTIPVDTKLQQILGYENKYLIYSATVGSEMVYTAGHKLLILCMCDWGGWRVVVLMFPRLSPTTEREILNCDYCIFFSVLICKLHVPFYVRLFILNGSLLG